jgi:Stage II sporulation protein E (SpoIIE)
LPAAGGNWPAVIRHRPSATDRKVQYFEGGSLATVLYAVVGNDRKAVTISSAGHLPPVCAPPDGPAIVVPAEQDLLIGLDMNAKRRSVKLDLEPGSVLCCFTELPEAATGFQQSGDHAPSATVDKAVIEDEQEPP